MTQEPLTGEAAAMALKSLIESTPYAEGYSPELTRDLLATGRIHVLPEPEPPCVERIKEVLFQRDGVSAAIGADYARALHAAHLCACRADALLQRVADMPGATTILSETRHYLAKRAR